MTNAREAGDAAETRAAAYLTEKGYRVIARNYRCRGGELDLIAQKEELLVFVEVKFRRTSSGARPAEAVTVLKQLRLSRAVGAYLASVGGWNGPMRFDVMEVTGDGAITHLENAFLPAGY